MAASIVRKINTPELVFISDISERDVHRIADEQLLSTRTPNGVDRRFDMVDLILVNFYFHTAKELSKSARLAAMEAFIEKFGATVNFSSTSRKDWTVVVGSAHDITINFANRIEEIRDRLREVERVKSMVSDKGEFNGEPVFSGTRVPVRTVEAFLNKGSAPEEVREQFPTLTDEMIAAAPLWARLHPAKGRPKSFGELNPSWSLKSSETVAFTRS